MNIGGRDYWEGNERGRKERREEKRRRGWEGKKRGGEGEKEEYSIRYNI